MLNIANHDVGSAAHPWPAWWTLLGLTLSFAACAATGSDETTPREDSVVTDTEEDQAAADSQGDRTAIDASQDQSVTDAQEDPAVTDAQEDPATPDAGDVSVDQSADDAVSEIGPDPSNPCRFDAPPLDLPTPLAVTGAEFVRMGDLEAHFVSPEDPDGWRAAFADDIDGDGLQDVLVNYRFRRSQIFWQQDDGSLSAGSLLPGGGCSVEDLDLDGRTDVFCASLVGIWWGGTGDVTEPSDYTYLISQGVPGLPFVSVTLADVTDDLWPDLILTGGNAPDRLFVNEGDRRFEDRGDALEWWGPRPDGRGNTLGHGVVRPDEALYVFRMGENGVRPSLSRQIASGDELRFEPLPRDDHVVSNECDQVGPRASWSMFGVGETVAPMCTTIFWVGEQQMLGTTMSGFYDLYYAVRDDAWLLSNKSLGLPSHTEPSSVGHGDDRVDNPAGPLSVSRTVNGDVSSGWTMLVDDIDGDGLPNLVVTRAASILYDDTVDQGPAYLEYRRMDGTGHFGPDIGVPAGFETPGQYASATYGWVGGELLLFVGQWTDSVRVWRYDGPHMTRIRVALRGFPTSTRFRVDTDSGLVFRGTSHAVVQNLAGSSRESIVGVRDATEVTVTVGSLVFADVAVSDAILVEVFPNGDLLTTNLAGEQTRYPAAE